LLKVQPDWEHGYGYYYLADCYEQAGRISDAKTAYQEALRFAPFDPVLRGGYASFLYLYGHPNEAFDEYLRLLKLDHHSGNAVGIELSTTALKTLGMRLGFSEDEVIKRIRSVGSIRDDR
jgi:tetratricopeptide (TPR) repeat protein